MQICKGYTSLLEAYAKVEGGVNIQSFQNNFRVLPQGVRKYFWAFQRVFGSFNTFFQVNMGLPLN